MIRASWLVLALVGVAFTVWFAVDSVGWMSMSCGKTGELYEIGARPGAQCSDSALYVYGWGRFTVLGAALVVPPLAAALAGRWWASVVTTVLLGLLAAFGLFHWSDFWGLLLVAGVPMTLAALLIAITHCGVVVFRSMPTSR